MSFMAINYDNGGVIGVSSVVCGNAAHLGRASRQSSLHRHSDKLFLCRVAGLFHAWVTFGRAVLHQLQVSHHELPLWSLLMLSLQARLLYTSSRAALLTSINLSLDIGFTYLLLCCIINLHQPIPWHWVYI